MVTASHAGVDVGVQAGGELLGLLAQCVQHGQLVHAVLHLLCCQTVRERDVGGSGKCKHIVQKPKVYSTQKEELLGLLMQCNLHGQVFYVVLCLLVVKL